MNHFMEIKKYQLYLVGSQCYRVCGPDTSPVCWGQGPLYSPAILKQVMKTPPPRPATQNYKFWCCSRPGANPTVAVSFKSWERRSAGCCRASMSPKLCVLGLAEASAQPGRTGRVLPRLRDHPSRAMDVCGSRTQLCSDELSQPL